MDLFSLTWQLAFSNGKLPMPLVITNGKKLYPINRLTPSSSKSMTIGSLKTRTQAYTLRHDNDQIFLALASDLGNVPALIRYNVGGKNTASRSKSWKWTGSPRPRNRQPENDKSPLFNTLQPPKGTPCKASTSPSNMPT